MRYNQKHPRTLKPISSPSPASNRLYAAVRAVTRNAPSVIPELYSEYAALAEDKLAGADVLAIIIEAHLQEMIAFAALAERIIEWAPNKPRKSVSALWHPVAFEMAKLIRDAFKQVKRKAGISAPTGLAIIIIQELFEMIGWDIKEETLVKAIRRFRIKKGQKRI